MSRKKIYTTVGIDSQILAAAREFARRDERTISFIVEKALKKFLGLEGAEQREVVEHAD